MSMGERVSQPTRPPRRPRSRPRSPRCRYGKLLPECAMAFLQLCTCRRSRPGRTGYKLATKQRHQKGRCWSPTYTKPPRFACALFIRLVSLGRMPSGTTPKHGVWPAGRAPTPSAGPQRCSQSLCSSRDRGGLGNEGAPCQRWRLPRAWRALMALKGCCPTWLRSRLWAPGHPYHGTRC